MATNTERQAAFKARMRAEGKKLIAVWVSPEQEKAIKAYLAGKGLLPVTPAQSEPEPDSDYQQWAAMLEAREAEQEHPSPVTPAKPEKAPERASADPFIARTFKKPKPEPVKPTLVTVSPSKPDRISEYEVWQEGRQLGRVWQVAEKPKWHGYPSGFNEKQFSGATKKEVVERIRRYKSF